jgi:hypothetical protein
VSKAIFDLTASNGARIRAGVTTGGQEPFVWLSQDDDSAFDRRRFDELIEELLDMRVLLWGPK